MPITFLCPQGHRLTCPDELAGKPGKCPKCGVVVRIPTAASPSPVPDEGDESRIESTGDNLTIDDLPPDQIIFLCPNGHRLNGPASLAGRPGQCPHCGVKFLVPSPDDEEEEEQAEEFVEQEQENFPLNDIVIQIDTSGKGGSSKSGKLALTSNSSVTSSAHPTAALLSQLWRYKAQGANVEVHLGDGKLLEPDRFSTKDANHAIFASQEGNGSYTLTAVAWTSIERIVVRGLEQLPKEWF